MNTVNLPMMTFLFWLLALLSFLLPDTVLANRYLFQGRLNVRSQYSDNISFERTNPREDVLVGVQPSFMFRSQTAKGLVDAKVTYDVIRYVEESNEDRENQDYSLNGRYKITERLTTRWRGGFRRDTSLDSLLTETGEVTRRQDVDRYLGTVGFDWRYSERTGAKLTYQYLNKQYEDSTSADYDRHSVHGSFDRYFNYGTDVFSLQPGYEYRQSDTGELDNYTVSLAWKHAFSETFTLFLSGGGRYSEQRYPGRDSEDSSGYVANARFDKKTDTTHSVLGYQRTLYTGISGTESEVDTFSCSFEKDLLRRLSVGVSGRLFFRRSPEDSNSGDRRYYQISPNLKYMLTEKHVLELGYRYANQYDDEEEIETLEKNSVWLVLRFRYDRIW